MRLQLAASDVISLRTAGTLAGVVVLAAGGANGTGIGRVIASLGNGGAAQLAWQAPGSATPGTPQPVSPDGNYLLEDGEDAAAFVRVAVYGSYLPQAGEARVYLGDRYNELGPADVSAADASAGLTTITQYTLANVSPSTVYDVRAWLPPVFYSPGITISSDGVNYFTPISETDPNVLTWASIAPGSGVTLYVKRVSSPGRLSDPAVLNELFTAWTGL